jgi:aspartyl-tRNA(Asn)/glutamyl-tRNA(Gln) amidotransferase subunit A
MAPLASGSDIGGSIRIPSSCNGVVGFKPPYGRVPEMPPFNLDAYAHTGPMARTVADCALLQNVLAGAHPVDHVSLRPTVQIPARLDGASGLRIGLAVNLGDWAIEPEVEANTRAVAEALRAAGAIVEEVHVGLRRADVERAAEIHFAAIFGTLVTEESNTDRELLSSYARQLTDRAAEPPGSWLEGLQIEAAINDRVAPIFERYDALICPTAGYPALRAGEDYLERDFSVAGQQVDPMFEATMTLPFNILSRHPVLAAPSGWASNGVPTGVQIVGRTYEDVTPFRIGAALEHERPWGYRDEQHLPPLAAGATI